MAKGIPPNITAATSVSLHRSLYPGCRIPPETRKLSVSRPLAPAIRIPIASRIPPRSFLTADPHRQKSTTVHYRGGQAKPSSDPLPPSDRLGWLPPLEFCLGTSPIQAEKPAPIETPWDPQCLPPAQLQVAGLQVPGRHPGWRQVACWSRPIIGAMPRSRSPASPP